MDEKDGSVTVANSKFVFTSKHGGKVSLNDIEIKRNPESASWRIAPKFNLGGIEAKGISISWPPFYTVDDCDQNVRCWTLYIFRYLSLFANLLFRVRIVKTATGSWMHS